MKTILQRVRDCAANRFTKGELYEMVDGKVIDDNGKLSKPYLENEDYWVVLQELTPAGKPILKETEMSNNTVEHVTLINGKRAEEVSNNRIISIIEDEQKKIERLQKINRKPLDKLITKHEETIDRLTSILEDRV